MRVKYALSARVSSAGIRASFTNDACASNAREMRVKVRVNLVQESARHLQITRTRQMDSDGNMFSIPTTKYSQYSS